MTCVVEPEYGFLVSELDIVTRQSNATIHYSGQASNFQQCGDFWYPETYEFNRRIGSFNENCKIVITEISQADQSDESSRLPFYGLPNPKPNRSANLNSSTTKTLFGLRHRSWVILGWAVVCFLITWRLVYKRKNRNV